MMTVSQRMMCLNTRYPVGVAGRKILDMEPYWGNTPRPWEFRTSAAFAVCALLWACCWIYDLSGSLFSFPLPSLPTMMNSLSGTVGQNKLFHKSLLVIVFYHNKSEVTNTDVLPIWCQNKLCIYCSLCEYCVSTFVKRSCSKFTQ